MISQNISQINPANDLSDLVNQEIGHNTINASYSKNPDGENEELRDTFANRDMQEAFHNSNMYFTQDGQGPNRNSSAKLLSQQYKTHSFAPKE